MLHNTAKFTAIEQKLIELQPSTNSLNLNKAIQLSIRENRQHWLLHERVFTKVIQHKNALEFSHYFFKNWTHLLLSNDDLINSLMNISSRLSATDPEQQTPLIDCQRALLSLMQSKAQMLASSPANTSPYTQLVNQLCRGEKWQASHFLVEESYEWQTHLSSQLNNNHQIHDKLLYVALIELMHCAELDIATTMIEQSLDNCFSLNQFAKENCESWFSLHRSKKCHDISKHAFDALSYTFAFEEIELTESQVTQKFSEIINHRTAVFNELATLFDIPEHHPQTITLTPINLPQ